MKYLEIPITQKVCKETNLGKEYIGKSIIVNNQELIDFLKKKLDTSTFNSIILPERYEQKIIAPKTNRMYTVIVL